MTQPALNFNSPNAAPVAIVSSTEIVVATLTGVVTPLGAQTVRLSGAAFVTTGTTTTAVIVRIRRASLSGLLVSDETGESLITAVSQSNWYSKAGIDTPGEVTGAVYVLTVQNTGGGTGGTTITAYLNAVVYQPAVLLTVDAAPDELTAVLFRFVVPGAQQWSLRSVIAGVDTDTGGQPDRGFLLQITDGTSVVAQVGNTDNGTEPAAGTLTWANAPGASSSAGNTFASLAPIPDLILNPGYNIIGTIVNPAAADLWTSAAVWYDFAYTDGR